MEIQRKESGFTMIEIIIALIVLVVGLVGILALFPVAIDAANGAAQRTTSGIIAESVEEALKDALRGAVLRGDVVQVTLVHAGTPNLRYQFNLPQVIDPALTAIGEDHPSADSVFIYRASDIGYSDYDLRRDPYGQYSYNFSVIRRSTNLYEFYIRVYRNFPREGGSVEQRARSFIHGYSCLLSTPFCVPSEPP